MVGQGKRVFFLINLLQDVNIVRGLVYLTARETDAKLGFLITPSFIKRDRQKIWQSELARIAADTGAQMYLYEQPEEALAVLSEGAGMIFAAAESNLSAHREVSEVFDVAPSTYLKVTLQHGLECVGFIQSREHVLSHGRNVSFHADIICAWFEAEALTSLTASAARQTVCDGPANAAPGETTCVERAPGRRSRVREFAFRPTARLGRPQGRLHGHLLRLLCRASKAG